MEVLLSAIPQMPPVEKAAGRRNRVVHGTAVLTSSKVGGSTNRVIAVWPSNSFLVSNVVLHVECFKATVLRRRLPRLLDILLRNEDVA